LGSAQAIDVSLDKPEAVPHGSEHSHAPHQHESHADELDRAHLQGHEHTHGALSEFLPWGHSHTTSQIDAALESSNQGIRAVIISLVVLLITAGFQVVITLISNSAALLTDTLHNFSDALTALPLWVAFSLARRSPNRRFTYGFGRAEDLAGLLVVLFILVSAVIAAYESINKLIDPRPVDHVAWVLVAGVIGFLGNEAVALYRIRVGNSIGSAALIADGQHARVDGLTSLAVVAGAIGIAAGFDIADGAAGLLITVVILLVLKDSALIMWYRLMDAVDPVLVSRIETEACVDGVEEVGEVRVRWVGHRLLADVLILVDEDLSTRESHAIAEAATHALYHAEPQLSIVNVHVDPCGHGGVDAHQTIEHHLPQSSPG
jgi:cation diffusion facilitator family transporter